MRALPVLACILALSACAPATPGPATGQTAPQPADGAARPSGERAAAEALLRQAASTVDELRAASPRRMLDAALEDARAVLVLPAVYRAGFFYSLHAGSGVLCVRRADGAWGAPVFVNMAGAGYGVQAGLERARFVIVLREEELAERVLAGGLSLEAQAGFDIVGVREDTGPGPLGHEKPVEIHADAAGLMAGVALRGGAMLADRGLTAAYYGPEAGTAEEILRGTNAPDLGAFLFWSALGPQTSNEPFILRGEARP